MATVIYDLQDQEMSKSTTISVQCTRLESSTRCNCQYSRTTQF